MTTFADDQQNEIPLSVHATGEPLDNAAAAARRIVTSVVAAGRTNPLLSTVAAELHRLADLLDEHAPPTETRLVEMWADRRINRHNPATGVQNPVSPPLVLQGRPDGKVSGTVSLPLPYQGPPRMVHGGVSALLLDQSLGIANHWAGRFGMTAELTVRYHRPTPLNTPLVVVAHQVSSTGRRFRAVGQICDESGKPYVTAHGEFVDKQLPRPGS